MPRPNETRQGIGSTYTYVRSGAMPHALALTQAYRGMLHVCGIDADAFRAWHPQK